ncbi:MAG: gamma-glutamyl-gamma-aminobutyrate hydrolase family protein [Panacibacter sp.]
MRIGLTYTGFDEKHDNYVRWLKQQDDIEVICIAADDEHKPDIKSFDGIVLSGGVDIFPEFYDNENVDYPHAPEEFHEARDEFEADVFNQCLENKLPVLCVCRGMQLVNCILGGNLTQDLGELNQVHKFENSDKAHGIVIEPGTLLNEITGVKRSVANSAHHQVIDELGNGLMVNSRSDEGIVEGIEWKEKTGKPFFLGVQWHPERMFKFHLEDTPLSKKIRDRFIEEIKKSKK